MSIINKNNTIAFLPGWGFRSSIWDEFIKSCHSFIKINNIDLPEENLGLDNILEQLNLKIFPGSIIAAWSLGGLLAIALCHRYPERYKKLILISSTPKFVSACTENWPGISSKKALLFYQQSKINISHLLENFLRLVQYPDRAVLLRNILKKYLIHPDQLSAYLNLQYYLELLIQSDFRKYYQQLSIPVYNILGEQDIIVPVTISVKLLKPNSAVNIIPDAGHIAFLTHPKIFREYFIQAIEHEFT